MLQHGHFEISRGSRQVTKRWCQAHGKLVGQRDSLQLLLPLVCRGKKLNQFLLGIVPCFPNSSALNLCGEASTTGISRCTNKELHLRADVSFADMKQTLSKLTTGRYPTWSSRWYWHCASAATFGIAHEAKKVTRLSAGEGRNAMVVRLIVVAIQTKPKVSCVPACSSFCFKFWTAWWIVLPKMWILLDNHWHILAVFSWQGNKGYAIPHSLQR